MPLFNRDIRFNVFNAGKNKSCNITCRMIYATFTPLLNHILELNVEEDCCLRAHEITIFASANHIYPLPVLTSLCVFLQLMPTPQNHRSCLTPERT